MSKPKKKKSGIKVKTVVASLNFITTILNLIIAVLLLIEKLSG